MPRAAVHMAGCSLTVGCPRRGSWGSLCFWENDAGSSWGNFLPLGLRLRRSHSIRDRLSFVGARAFQPQSHFGPEESRSSRAAKRAYSLPSVVPRQTVQQMQRLLGKLPHTSGMCGRPSCTLFYPTSLPAFLSLNSTVLMVRHGGMS